MWTGTDVAREIGVARRAEAHQAALTTAVRLARRQERLTARRKRLEAALEESLAAR
jgi:hypothetical protein